MVCCGIPETIRRNHIVWSFYGLCLISVVASCCFWCFCCCGWVIWFVAKVHVAVVTDFVWSFVCIYERPILGENPKPHIPAFPWNPVDFRWYPHEIHRISCLKPLNQIIQEKTSLSQSTGGRLCHLNSEICRISWNPPDFMHESLCHSYERPLARNGKPMFVTVVRAAIAVVVVFVVVRSSDWWQRSTLMFIRRVQLVVTHGQQQYVVTYSTHKTTMPSVYFLYVPYNCGHLWVVLSSCHNMDSQQCSSCSS